jgi:hypothetical protein
MLSWLHRLFQAWTFDEPLQLQEPRGHTISYTLPNIPISINLHDRHCVWAEQLLPLQHATSNRPTRKPSSKTRQNDPDSHINASPLLPQAVEYCSSDYDLSMQVDHDFDGMILVDLPCPVL